MAYTDYTALIAQYARNADRAYRRARREARDAEQQYQNAANWANHAAWLTRYPEYQDEETSNTPATWERVAATARRIGDARTWPPASARPRWPASTGASPATTPPCECRGKARVFRHPGLFPIVPIQLFLITLLLQGNKQRGTQMTKSLTPAEFDAKELEVYTELWEIESHLPAIWNLVHKAAGDKQVSNGYGRPKSWDMTDEAAMGWLVIYAATDAKAAALLQRFQVVEQGMEERRAVIESMETEYAREPWTRWFKCTNADGHVHSSLRGCKTVQWDTGMAWVTEMSGQDVAVAVADPRLGPTLCSVCFPGAPVELRQSQRDVDRAAREAAKAAREEAKYVKRLRDGERFRDSRHSWVETVARCKEVLREEVEYRDYYGRGEHPFHAGSLLDAEEAARVLLAREAAQAGTGATQAEIDRIVASAVKKNIKDGARLDPVTGQVTA